MNCERAQEMWRSDIFRASSMLDAAHDCIVATPLVERARCKMVLWFGEQVMLPAIKKHISPAEDRPRIAVDAAMMKVSGHVGFQDERVMQKFERAAESTSHELGDHGRNSMDAFTASATVQFMRSARLPPSYAGFYLEAAAGELWLGTRRHEVQVEAITQKLRKILKTVIPFPRTWKDTGDPIVMRDHWVLFEKSRSEGIYAAQIPPLRNFDGWYEDNLEGVIDFLGNYSPKAIEEAYAATRELGIVRSNQRRRRA